MSIKIYPVIDVAPVCNDYSIKINGVPAKTNTARVSAIPFNRRWPGHQRGIEQSEPIQFLSLEADEKMTFEITPNKPFDKEKVKIRPQSLGIKPQFTEDGKIIFTLEKPAYFTVEAYGRSHAFHIFADEISNYGIDKNGEDVIYFGKGEHDVGFIELHDNQTLFIDEGAVVYACIRAKDVNNIKIVGRGILDNSRNKETIFFEANVDNNNEAVNNAKREHTVQIEYCTNVLIDGITLRDSLVYNIRPIGCENLEIRNVKIIGCWRFNSDGIDMHNCKKVHIDNCFIRTFDDSICVKGFDFYDLKDIEKAVHEATYHNGKVYDVFTDTVIENCVIWNDWGKCLEIGAETKAEEIYNICFKNCDIIHVTHKVLDCMNVDYADVHDIVYKDINIEADEIIPPPSIQKNDADVYKTKNVTYMPYTISVTTEYHHEYSAGSLRRGKSRKFLFKNIHVYSDKSPRCHFKGHSESANVDDITISNLYWNEVPVEKLEGDNWVVEEFATNIRLITE